MARHFVIMSGAGISADSGVATFRGAGGLWEGKRIEDVATPRAWGRDPEGVWRFYQTRRAGLLEVEPNPAHHALVKLERTLEERGEHFTLITQNVDDLHERAGSKNLLHMHGELSILACERCGTKGRDLENLDPTVFQPCPACGHERLRPDVVWFGEVPYHLEEIESALSTCTDFIAVGTSGQVQPAASFLEFVRSQGANTWVLALERPENVHPADTYIEGRAAVTMPKLVDELLLTH